MSDEHDSTLPDLADANQSEPPQHFFAAALTHLRRLGYVNGGSLPPWRLLSGGISNWVVLFECNGGVVVKGALARLRVPELWLADPTRAVLEGRAMAALGARLPHGSVPRVLFVDESASLVGMACAPAAATPWKDALLRGDVDPNVAREVGTLLGRMHRAAWDDMEIASQFRNLDLFRQLRLDPYHGRAADVADERGEHDVARLLREGANAMTGRRSTLVHGDYSPKNLLVTAGGVMAIDFEVVHWGNPDFDTAFLLTHLALKAIHRPAAAASLADAAHAFLEGYAAAVERRGLSEATDGALRQAGCLIRARADGKSRVEYLDAAGLATARVLGAALLRGTVTGVDELFGRVEER